MAGIQANAAGSCCVRAGGPHHGRTYQVEDTQGFHAWLDISQEILDRRLPGLVAHLLAEKQADVEERLNDGMACRDGLGNLNVGDGQTVCVSSLKQVWDQVVMRYVGTKQVKLLVVERRLLDPDGLFEVSVFVK